MATHQADKMARMLEQVRNLLARADHPNTPKEEADTCRTRADTLIQRYRLEESELASSGEAAITVGFRDIVLAPLSSEFSNHYWWITQAVARYLDVEVTLKYDRRNYERTMMVAEFVGFESDLALADLLVTECVSEFGRHLEPKHDPSESNEANAYRLRAGGWERRRIADVLFGVATDEADMKSKNRKVTRLIIQHAERNGLDHESLLGRGNNIKGYRATFAEEFYYTISSRLFEAARNRSEDGALVFANRKERIREALYERYPERRPRPVQQVEAGTGLIQATCKRCEKAKSGSCREHAVRAYRGAKGPAWSAAGAARGQAAASAVDLGVRRTGKIAQNEVLRSSRWCERVSPSGGAQGSTA